jgi:hypothetical protein
MIRVTKPAILRNATTVAHRNGTRVYVQSPNGTWMLLDGHWHNEGSAAQYAINAGYVLLPGWQVLDEIESQGAPVAAAQ